MVRAENGFPLIHIFPEGPQRLLYRSTRQKAVVRKQSAHARYHSSRLRERRRLLSLATMQNFVSIDLLSSVHRASMDSDPTLHLSGESIWTQ